MDTTDPLAILDMAKDEMTAAKAARKVSNRNGGVCVCGHGAGSHTTYSTSDHPMHIAARDQGKSMCIPSRVECGCVTYQEVLKTSDLRSFRYSTQGFGAQHALSQGVHAAITSGKTIEWNVGLHCVACKGKTSDGVKLIPVAYNKVDMSVAYKTTDTNVLICADCMDKIRNRA